MQNDLQPLIERLREQARRESDAHRMMAEAKSLRQGDCDPPRKDLYMWLKPEQTDSWKAADALERFTTPITDDVVERVARALYDFDVATEKRLGRKRSRRWDSELPEYHEHMREKARAAISAFAVPEGWQLVPVEPTEAMVEAGEDGVTSMGRNWTAVDIAATYRAMLSAAPKGGE